MKLAEQIFSGDRRAVARMITAVENNADTVRGDLESIYARTGNAYRLGITGPSGSGKSTLVDVLTQELREKGLTVGIIAIDPTSPFTGGALLGDRIRMQRIGLDPGVFIRSMATRGSLGGLCAAAGDAADILDAYGKDVVLTETVGGGDRARSRHDGGGALPRDGRRGADAQGWPHGDCRYLCHKQV